MELPSDEELQRLTGISQEVLEFQPDSEVYQRGQSVAHHVLAIYADMVAMAELEPATLWHIPIQVRDENHNIRNLLVTLRVDPDAGRDEGLMVVEFPFPMNRSPRSD